MDILTVWWLGSKVECAERETGENHMTFCNLIVEVLQYYFRCPVFTKAIKKALQFQGDGEDAPSNGGVGMF